MKQVFCVQSHITFLIAKTIIREEKFDKSNVVFIITRNYCHIDIEGFTKIDLSREHENISEKTLLQRFFSHISSCKKIDDKIKREIGEHFVLYLPLIRNHFFQILATNEFCRTVNMVEEGVSAYASNMVSLENEQGIKKAFKNIFNTLSKALKYRMFFTSHYDISCLTNINNSVFYCLSDRAFSSISKPKRVLDLCKNITLSSRSKFELKSNTVLVLEGAVEQNNLSLNVFLSGINEIIKHIDTNRIHVKYHPVQSSENILKIKNIFEKNKIEAFEIPQKIAFEDILIESKNLDVYGFSSSLLLYTKILGSSPYVFEEILYKDDVYKKFRQGNNYDIRELINQI